MKIELTDDQRSALGELLREALGDLSSEIAATDNPAYRDGLRTRRLSLEGVSDRARTTGRMTDHLRCVLARDSIIG